MPCSITDSILDANNKRVASPASIKDAKLKSSIHFVKGNEVLSILDKNRDNFKQLKDRSRSRKGKLIDVDVLVARQTWWHNHRKESNAFSNSPPLRKSVEKSDKHLKRVLRKVFSTGGNNENKPFSSNDAGKDPIPVKSLFQIYNQKPP